MEAVTASDEPSTGKRAKGVPKAAREADSSLLRLPVEVHRRILSFLNYDHQLSLLECSSSLRKVACRAMTRAGFAGPISRLAGMLPEVRDLALSPSGAFRVSDLKDMRLQSLYLVFFHECAFTMECEEGIADDAPIKQLESLGMQWEEPSADGSKALGDAMAQVLRCLTPLPRLERLLLTVSHPGAWSAIAPILLTPVARPAGGSTSGVPAPPPCPFPALVRLDLDLTQRGFFELLSALEDPAVLPTLQEVAWGISDEVRFVDLLEALASRPTVEGSRVLRFLRVRITSDYEFIAPAPGEIPDCWRPGGSLAYRQACVLLRDSYTEPARRYKGMLDLLQDPARTIPRSAILERLLVADGLPIEGPLPECIQVITDAILAELTTATEHRQKERRDDMLAVLAGLAGDDGPIHPVIWAKVSSRPDFIRTVVSFVRQPGQQAQDAMQALGRVSSKAFSAAADSLFSDAPDGGLADLLGVIDFMRYREWQFMDRSTVRANRRVVTSLLNAVPKPVAHQAMSLRFADLLIECLHGLGMQPQHGDDEEEEREQQEEDQQSTEQLLGLLETVEGARPKIKQVILARGKLALARLAYGLRTEVLEELAADEDVLRLAKEMMDAAVEATWTRGVVSFEVCQALWGLLQVGRFRQWLVAHYSQVDITALLLSCRPEYPMTFHELRGLVCTPDQPQLMSLQMVEALLQCAMSTHPSHEGGGGKGPRAELVVRALAMGLMWNGPAEPDEQRFGCDDVIPNFKGREPLPRPSPQELVETEVGQSLLRLLISYAIDKATTEDKPMAAVRSALLRWLYAGLRHVRSPPANTTPLHEPFATLAVLSREHNWPVVRRLMADDVFTAALVLMGAVSSDPEDLARCLWQLRRQYPRGFKSVYGSFKFRTPVGSDPPNRMLVELQRLYETEHAPSVSAIHTEEEHDSAGGLMGNTATLGGGADGEDGGEDGMGGEEGGGEDEAGGEEGGGEDEMGDGEDEVGGEEDGGGAEMGAEEDGGEDEMGEEGEGGAVPAEAESAEQSARRLEAYHSRKKVPWAPIVAFALASSDERGSILVEEDGDDYDAQMRELEGGTMDEADIWKYMPKYA